MKRSALMWAIAALVPMTANAACVIEPLEPELQAAETVYVGTVVRSVLIPSLDQLHIALLRGINVGKAKRIAMADLRALLEDLGYTDVGTLLNSGNVVFKAGKGVPKKLAADISAAIATHLGIEVPVIVVSAKELALIVRENPFASADDPSRLLVAFVADAGMLSAMSAIEPHVVAPEQFHVGTHAAYLHCASGILEPD